mmetsp:Transcript_44794/g.124542  ORF Transcript_44794/g.124542 Transcript_44794/m.124542 type:complete len:420 (-) Transcript_44794:1462-2721(-)
MGDGNEVPKGAHWIGIPCPHICGRHWRELLVLDFVDGDLLSRERHADSRTRGAHVFEGSGRRHARGLGQLVDQLPCVHCVKQVDVAWGARHDLEGQLASSEGTQCGRVLVGVASVLQRPLDMERHGLRGGRGGDLTREPAADAGIVGCGESVCRGSEVPPEGEARGAAALCHLTDELGVLRGACDDGHGIVVLRRRADHGRPTNVDVLNAGSKVPTLLHCLDKRVQVHNDKIDASDAVFRHLGLVLGVATRGQEATMDLRVQRLHTAVKDLRRARVVGHILHSAAQLPQLGGGAARGQYVHALLGEEAPDLLQARLVEDRDQHSLHPHHVSHIPADCPERVPTCSGAIGQCLAAASGRLRGLRGRGPLLRRIGLLQADYALLDAGAECNGYGRAGVGEGLGGELGHVRRAQDEGAGAAG